MFVLNSNLTGNLVFYLGTLFKNRKLVDIELLFGEIWKEGKQEMKIEEANYRVCLLNPVCSGIHSADQPGLDLTETYLHLEVEYRSFTFEL